MKKFLTTLIVSCLLVIHSFGQTVLDIIVNSPDHNTLETAVIAAGLDDDLSGVGPFTVFAPTDAAFDALPSGTLATLLTDPTGALARILRYHLTSEVFPSSSLFNNQIIFTRLPYLQSLTVTINPDGVFINNAKVTVTNLQATNGIVHVIDAVLLPPSPTIMDVVANSGDHGFLTTALVASGLTQTLDNPGNFTLFAPTDAAFIALSQATIDALFADPTGALANVLTYHATSGTALSTSLSNGQVITMLNGETVTVTINADGVFINNAKVTVADIIASNGVVHVVDAIILPQPTQTVMDIIAASPVHNTLEGVLITTGLNATLSGAGTFTVFAPTDAAFEEIDTPILQAIVNSPTTLLTDILLNHVLGVTALSSSLSDGQMVVAVGGDTLEISIVGSDVFVNDAQVIVTDLVATNGVVHVIDAVLIPGAENAVTVWDIIEGSNIHNTLQVAIETAGLVDALDSDDDAYMVFAPTDAAFAAIPAATLQAILADPSGLLTEILTYHVTNDPIVASELINGEALMTLNGADVTITINADGVFVNNAKVIVTDLVGINGVVHVIDAILLPPANPTVWEIIQDSPDHNTLEIAISVAGLDGTLQGNGTFTVIAPTDAAFAAIPSDYLTAIVNSPTSLLTDILLNHVVGATALSTDLSNGQTIIALGGDTLTVNITGGNVFINNAQVTVVDIIASNGVVHVIDAVMLPGVENAVTVWDIIESSNVHNTLQLAVETASLDGLLQSEGAFTVFAPVDAAFAAVPPATLQAVLADPAGALTLLLTYHVATNGIIAAALSNNQSVTMANGRDAVVTINANGAFINQAGITVTDLMAINGVVHVIDAVIGTNLINTDEAFTAEQVQIFPTLAQDFVQVELSDIKNAVQVNLLDMSGKVLQTQQDVRNNTQLDVTALSAGTYLIQVMDQNRQFIQRIVRP